MAFNEAAGVEIWNHDLFPGMADDREILREVWDGRIPICFVLANQEIETLEEPEPYFVRCALILKEFDF